MYEHFNINNFSKTTNCVDGRKELRLRAFDMFCCNCEEFRRKDVLTEPKYNPSALPRVTKEVAELMCAMDDVIKYEGVVGFDIQERVLASMGLSWFVKGLYDHENKGESLIQFMERNILEQYKSKGWSLLSKDVSKVLKMKQDLRGKIKGDILSIRNPDHSKILYPTLRDHFFNVHYESHDDKTFESIQKLPTPWIQYGLSLPEDDEES